MDVRPFEIAAGYDDEHWPHPIPIYPTFLTRAGKYNGPLQGWTLDIKVIARCELHSIRILEDG